MKDRAALRHSFLTIAVLVDGNKKKAVPVLGKGQLSEDMQDKYVETTGKSFWDTWILRGRCLYFLFYYIYKNRRVEIGRGRVQ